ncbi:hypothetical protein ACRALDRAFT_1060634 [Sodiomyces alcalophilus JCM 7366]|uniref:uncharacterized protein n=1 Tax=Sodiomyces alcalophilus JCM 7366 TaxID=591952 RepID=UPI0039B38EE0
MKGAGVNIDAVIESVLAQRCDALAGWWSLLIEKEERKVRRREQKRRERDADSKSLRRLSAASSRLERMSVLLAEMDEDGRVARHMHTPRTRGRSERRSAHYADFELPGLPEHGKESGNTSPVVPPPPVDKDSIRSVSTSRHRRPIPPPKESVVRSARSRGSTLHLVTTSDVFSSGGTSTEQDGGQQKVRKKPSQAIVATWKNWTHWFFENTRRAKNANRKGSHSTPNLHDKNGNGPGGKHSKEPSPRPQTSKYPTTDMSGAPKTKASLPRGVVANGHMAKAKSPSPQPQNGYNSSGAYGSSNTRVVQGSAPPRIVTNTSYKRQSLSPSPLTPRSTIRRSSAGLRGRKSTSSSVSSIRSMPHHHHTHSKASSTSSNGSVSASKTPLQRGHSPHHSVKVLPAPPLAPTFPSNIRLVRGGGIPAPISVFNEGMPSSPHPQAPGSPNPFATGGVLFAKRKRNIFKGPMQSGGHGTRNMGSGTHSRSASSSGLGRRSGEITIQEEEEDEEGAAATDEYIEEVDNFTPTIAGPGERVEERLVEEDEEGRRPSVEHPGSNREECPSPLPSPVGPPQHLALEAKTSG